MGKWMQSYAFDVIGNLTYSEPFGFLQKGAGIENTLVALDQILLYGAVVGLYSYLHPLMYRITEHLPGTGAAARAFLMKFVRSRMALRQRERAERDEKGLSTSYRASDMSQDFLDKISDVHDRSSFDVTNYHVFMMGLAMW